MNRFLALYQGNWLIFSAADHSAAWAYAQRRATFDQPLIDVIPYTGIIGSGGPVHVQGDGEVRAG